MAILYLSCLGSFQAQLSGQPLNGFLSNKARALLIYLAVESAHAHSRGQLAGLFWPDTPDATARTYLRHALANLRKILGDRDAVPPFLLVARDTLQFNGASSWQLDMALLKQELNGLPNQTDATLPATQLAALEAAVARYHSPFLTGFYLNGCPAFEEWILLTRERLQLHILEILRLVADQYEVQGELAAAIRMLQRQVELEPWLEEAHQRLMMLFVRSGQRSAALAQYERCRHQLAEELGLEPNARTTELAARIRSGTFPDTTSQNMDESETIARLAPNPKSVLRYATDQRARHNLPAQTTALIGRTQERNALQRLLNKVDVRLITLTGPGGVGKTRLALQVGQESVDLYPDGVTFVPLAAIREPALVMSAIAQILGVRESSTRSVEESVQAALKDARTLLLLDNFEQVIEAASILADLLAACPYLNLLVTSRTVLHVYGEHEYRLSPLSVPDEIAQTDLEKLAAYPAIELFRQRAQAVRQDFMLDAATGSSVAQICTQLDGLPLAIELAAARCKVFSPQALLSHLSAQEKPAALHFLSAPKRNLPKRHHSLWQTIAWSYDLLTANEQALFRALGVFAGGWTLTAADAICNAAAEFSLDMLDGLSALVDKNLVRPLADGQDEPRFTMLETIREFALASLEASGEASTVQRRHADHYASMAEEADTHMRGKDQDQWLARLDREHDNLRAALAWATSHNEIEPGLRIIAATFRYWLRRGLEQEGFTRIEALLNITDELPPSVPLATVLFAAGLMADNRVDIDKKVYYFEWCITVCRVTDNDFRLSYALSLLSSLAYDQGDYAKAEKLDKESLQIAQALGDTWQVAMQLSNGGKQWATLGEFARGRRLAEQGLALHRELGDKWGTAIALDCLGIVAHLEGQLAEARSCFQESLRLNRELRDEPSICWSHYYLALVTLDEGELDQAANLLQIPTRAFEELGRLSKQADVLDALAHLAMAQGRPRRTLRLAGAAAAMRATARVVLPPVLQARSERVLAMARQQLPVDQAAAAWAEGAEMTLDAVRTYATMARA